VIPAAPCRLQRLGANRLRSSAFLSSSAGTGQVIPTTAARRELPTDRATTRWSWASPMRGGAGRPHHDDTCSRVSPGHGPSSRGALGCIAIVVAHAPASAPGLVTGACSTPAGTACVSAVCRQIKLARAGELHDAVEGT
jgi:hypothetical protein